MIGLYILHTKSTSILRTVPYAVLYIISYIFFKKTTPQYGQFSWPFDMIFGPKRLHCVLINKFVKWYIWGVFLQSAVSIFYQKTRCVFTLNTLYYILIWTRISRKNDELSSLKCGEIPLNPVYTNVCPCLPSCLRLHVSINHKSR